MSDLMKYTGNELLELLHGRGEGLVIPRPFKKEIFLFDTVIAGTSHVENIEVIEDKLKVNDRLELYREPENKYDKEAIVIKTNEGEKVGYVPKADNVIFSRLMDAGKLLFCKISKKEKHGKWVKIYIKVYLNEF